MSDPAVPRRPQRWHIDIPDLSGRRAVVTGASDGIGVEIARGLALGGAEVIMPVRSKAKGAAVIERLRSADPGASLALRSLDLSSLASTEALVRQLVAEGAPIEAWDRNCRREGKIILLILLCGDVREFSG